MGIGRADMRLHHVGYVVADIAGSAAEFVASLDCTWDGIIHEDPLQRVRVTFLSTHPSDPLIELVAPAVANSPVSRFLEQNGGGLHHVCYEVSDIEQQMAELKRRGARIVSRPRPAVAFNGRRIAWMLTAGSLLTELLESTPSGVNGA